MMSEILNSFIQNSIVASYEETYVNYPFTQELVMIIFSSIQKLVFHLKTVEIIL